MSSNLKKRKCVFNDSLQKEFKMFRKTEDISVVECITCNYKKINLAAKGKLDLLQHLNSGKHRKNVSCASTSKDILNFFQNNSDEENLISACESVLAYHVVKHQHSFLSNDCTIKLLANIFKDSKIATRLSSGRTKTEAIINNVLAPLSLKNFKNEIEDDKVRFVGVSTDGSNHGAVKMFPIVVTYFSQSHGVKKILLNIESVKNETAETVSKILIDNMNKFNILNKCVAFGGDNCNTNFGGRERKGENNVFVLLKKNEELKKLVGIGCPAHILNNCLRHGTDLWPTDIESIIAKLHNYFATFCVRSEQLKEYCEFLEVSYKNLLYSSKTRWLSLFPAIERTIQMYDPLKAYFLSIEKAPVILKSFFENPLSEAFLFFLHSLASVFHSRIEQIKREFNSLLEIVSILQSVEADLQKRISNKFLPLSVVKILKENDGNQNECVVFKKRAFQVYEECLKYLQLWTKDFNFYGIFNWMSLKEKPTWDEIFNCLQFLSADNWININDSLLLSQYDNLANFVEKMVDNPEFQSMLAHEKWKCFFGKVNSIEQKSEFLKICEYFFCIPAHNATIERIFSLINKQWTDDRNRLNIETVTNLMLVKFNFKLTCNEFYESVKENKIFLKNVRTSQKYKEKCDC